MKYEVVFAADVVKQLRRIDRKWQLKIVAVAEVLGDNPRPQGYKKLVDEGDFCGFALAITALFTK